MIDALGFPHPQRWEVTMRSTNRGDLAVLMR